MTVKKQIVKVERELLKFSYIIVNKDLYIEDVYQDEIGLFPIGISNLKGKPIEKVINKDYVDLVSKIGIEKSEESPVLYELLNELDVEYEVEVLPFGHNIMIFIKSKTNDKDKLVALTKKNKKLEAKYHELLLAKEHADRANREKTDLLLLLGHEFRNPLNSINGFLHLLMSNSEEPLTMDQQNRLSKIGNASKQLEMIMNDAIDFVRLDQVKLRVKTENIDVYGLIEDCIQAQSLDATAKNIKVIHQKGESNLSILSDSNRLTQVLMNVLSNAVKYTNEGGFIHVNSYKYAHRLLIEINDSGVGIHDNDLAFIFSPYYRSSSTDSMSTGLGIGLSLVKQILTELGGSIHVTSEVKVGSRFIIELPI
jgi:signal transduction histidine kinase